MKTARRPLNWMRPTSRPIYGERSGRSGFSHSWAGFMFVMIWTCILLVKLEKDIIKDILCCSYMDTEQYEEAVRDYEKVYQTEKTKGENQTTSFSFFSPLKFCLIVFNLLYSRTQAPPEKCSAGVEEKQTERLLQSTWGGQERYRGRDQESLPQTGTFTSPRCLTEQRIFILFIVQF